MGNCERVSHDWFWFYSRFDKKSGTTFYSATRLTVATQQTFLQVSQSGYANLINGHASLQSPTRQCEVPSRVVRCLSESKNMHQICENPFTGILRAAKASRTSSEK